MGIGIRMNNAFHCTFLPYYYAFLPQHRSKKVALVRMWSVLDSGLQMGSEQAVGCHSPVVPLLDDTIYLYTYNTKIFVAPYQIDVSPTISGRQLPHYDEVSKTLLTGADC